MQEVFLTELSLSTEQLQAIMPSLSKERAESYIEPLNKAMERWEINTPPRQAAFLAQIAHESTELSQWREIASGKAYEGRQDLGNVLPGDGPKYKGGGPMQLTGRSNYRRCGRAIKQPLEKDPSLITHPDVGFMAAGWFWTQEKKLNKLADKGTREAFNWITRRINGGLNGQQSRVKYWNRAKKVLLNNA